ncbi:MAG TPA: HIT family protein [Terriglobales bacterium]|nr:HIT family protein [Terriglobales bacterium]
MAAEGCIFCAIVAGRAPAARVYEDDVVLVFLDIFPVSRGHTLVILKQHCENIFAAPAESLAVLMPVSRRVALALRQTLSPAGLAIAQLNGAAAGQTVFHYHMHLVPRAGGEGLVLHGRGRADDADLQQLAAALGQALAMID